MSSTKLLRNNEVALKATEQLTLRNSKLFKRCRRVFGGIKFLPNIELPFLSI